jgi:hypothetical protein
LFEILTTVAGALWSLHIFACFFYSFFRYFKSGFKNIHTCHSIDQCEYVGPVRGRGGEGGEGAWLASHRLGSFKIITKVLPLILN